MGDLLIELIVIGVTVLPLVVTAYLTFKSLKNGSTFFSLMKKAIFFILLVSAFAGIVAPVELPHGGGISRLMVGAVTAAAMLLTVFATAGIYTVVKEDWT